MEIKTKESKMQTITINISTDSLYKSFESEFESYRVGIREDGCGIWNSLESFETEKKFFLNMVKNFIDNGLYTSQVVNVEEFVNGFIYGGCIMEFDDAREEGESDKDLIERLRESCLYVDDDMKLFIESF